MLALSRQKDNNVLKETNQPTTAAFEAYQPKSAASGVVWALQQSGKRWAEALFALAQDSTFRWIVKQYFNTHAQDSTFDFRVTMQTLFQYAHGALMPCSIYKTT